MAFQEVNDLSTDNTIALGGTNKQTGRPNPTKIEGYYLGKRQVDSKKSKTGKAYIYVFQTPKGNVGVWGKTDLDRKMESAVPGHMLRVTQSGMASTPNGEMYKYKVEFDATNTIEVQSGPTNSYAATDGDSYTEQGYGTSESEEEDDSAYGGYDTPVSKSASALNTSASERAAKVQALLSKNKKN